MEITNDAIFCPKRIITINYLTDLVSLADVCQHLVENLVRLGVVGDVLEAEDILEALAVVSEDLLTGGLVEELRW